MLRNLCNLTCTFHRKTNFLLYSSFTIKPIFAMSTKASNMDENLVWVDLEMTGLDVDTHCIMEAAVMVTDSHLNIVKEGPNLILNVDEDKLALMSEWCKKHHAESGLVDACRKSSLSLSQAEDQLLQFVSQYTEHGKCPIAGNSVHADKRFLAKYMPKFIDHLHYRIIDVSTVKELCRRWYPVQYNAAPKKALSHRALDDIKESIEELKYYRTAMFK